jgi:hypothetical protein
LSDGALHLAAAVSLAAVHFSSDVAFSATATFVQALRSARSLALSLGVHCFTARSSRSAGRYACAGRAGGHSVFTRAAARTAANAGTAASIAAHALCRREADACQQRRCSKQKFVPVPSHSQFSSLVVHHIPNPANVSSDSTSIVAARSPIRNRRSSVPTVWNQAKTVNDAVAVDDSLG